MTVLKIFCMSTSQDMLLVVLLLYASLFTFSQLPDVKEPSFASQVPCLLTVAAGVALRRDSLVRPQTETSRYLVFSILFTFVVTSPGYTVKRNLRWRVRYDYNPYR